MNIKFCPYCGRPIEGVPNYDIYTCPKCRVGWYVMNLEIVDKALSDFQIKEKELIGYYREVGVPVYRESQDDKHENPSA